MKLSGVTVIKIIKCILTALLICMLLAAKPGFASGEEASGKHKVLIFIIDQIGVEDIDRGNVPALKKLIKNGGIGLMNVRGKAFSWENRESGYLSLNMGKRASYPQDSGQTGNLGRIARENGIKITAINHSAAGPERNLMLLAADERGKIPYTAAATNDQMLLGKIKSYYQKSDIIIVDYGPATDNLQDADRFLGQAVELMDPENTLVLVVTPNPSRKMIRQGNFSLTTMVAAGPGIDAGILTSNTTKRAGLISNEDFAPTVLGFLGVTKDPVFIGEPVKVIKHGNSLKTILNTLNEFKNLKISRYIIHGFYVTGVVLALCTIYFSVLKERRCKTSRFLPVLTYSILSLPMAVFVLSPFLDFSSTFLYVFVIVAAAGSVGFLVNCRKDAMIYPLGAISLITSVTLLFGLLSGGSHYLASPLGFDDVFMGGRYYGINNDAMGILLGSTVLGLFVFLEKFNMPRFVTVCAGFIFTIMTVISMTPVYGANVGGTIAAMVVTTVTVVVLVSKKQINWRHVVFIVIAVFAVEIGIAYLDATLNTEKTHAGKVLTELMAGSFFGKFIQILWSKLSLFFLMLVVPPWNLILLAEFYLLYRFFRQGEFRRLYGHFPYLTKGYTVLFIGGLVAFLFNDTGVIATAMMFTYLVLPMALLIHKTGSNR